MKRIRDHYLWKIYLIIMLLWAVIVSNLDQSDLNTFITSLLIIICVTIELNDYEQ